MDSVAHLVDLTAIVVRSANDDDQFDLRRRHRIETTSQRLAVLRSRNGDQHAITDSAEGCERLVLDILSGRMIDRRDECTVSDRNQAACHLPINVASDVGTSLSVQERDIHATMPATCHAESQSGFHWTAQRQHKLQVAWESLWFRRFQGAGEGGQHSRVVSACDAIRNPDPHPPIAAQTDTKLP